MKNVEFEEFTKKHITYKIDKNNPDLFHFSLKKGNIDIKFTSEIFQANKIAKSGLLNYELIDGYEAIYSSSLRIVECQLGNFSEDDYEELCCYMTSYEQQFDHDGNLISSPPSEIIFDNECKAKISIGYFSKPFRQLLALKHNDYVSKRQNKFTLKISLNKLKKHDEAKKKLEKFGYSLLYEIDINYFISIILQKDQAITKRNLYEWNIDKESVMALDNEWNNLKLIYPHEPTSYFLKANIMHDLRFYQFLLFYHCLEYYFPDLIDQTKSNKEIYLLTRLIEDCVQQNDVKNFINNRKRLSKYFIKNTTYKEISDYPIYGTGRIVSLNKVSLRIYDIRCSIVHKKNDSRKNKLYPNLKTFELIKHDNELLKYIAEKVIKKHSIKI